MAKRVRRSKAEMNVVPYIDVMLVLLVIFMIAAPLIQRSVEVDLPEISEESSEEVAQTQDLTLPLIVSVDASGLLYLNVADDPNQALADNNIQELSRAYLAEHPQIDVYVRGDRNARYEAIIHAMEQLKAAGAQKVQLSSQLPEPAGE